MRRENSMTGWMAAAVLSVAAVVAVSLPGAT